MGSGSYQAADWARLKNSRGLNQAASYTQTFKNTDIKQALNSRFINIRESLDSEDSPNSTPVILGFDVTGSMGYLANEIATNTLNETITKILSSNAVTNPHMMCAAFSSPRKPLQATQFEADIRVVEQLLDFSLGGGNTYAYDNMLWYFAAKHTKIDSFDKRGKKGILIGIGDEKCGMKENMLGQECIEPCFGDKMERGKYSIKFMDAYNMASEKYEVYHIEIGPDFRFEDAYGGCVFDGWKEALPGRVARLHADKVEYMSDVIVAIIQLSQGVTRDVVLSKIEDPKTRAVVESSIAYMFFPQAGENIENATNISDIAIWSDNKEEEMGVKFSKVETTVEKPIAESTNSNDGSSVEFKVSVENIKAKTTSTSETFNSAKKYMVDGIESMEVEPKPVPKEVPKLTYVKEMKKVNMNVKKPQASAPEAPKEKKSIREKINDLFNNRK